MASDAGSVLMLGRLGGTVLALPASAVQRVLPMPDHWQRLPRHRGAVIGLVPALGSHLPLVDLGRWIQVDAPPSESAQPTGVLVVLQEGERTVALQLDALTGLRRVAAQDVRTLHHTSSDDELFVAVVDKPLDGVPVAPVLEVDRLMRLSSVWCEGLEEDAAQAADQQTARAVGEATQVLVRLGTVHLAIPARAVAELLPRPVLSQRWPPGEFSRGAAHWRGHVVAVLDAQAVLGEPLGDGVAEPPWSLALDLGSEGRVLLPVSEMLGLRQGVHGVSVDEQGWLGARLEDPALGSVTCLDPERLLARLPEARLSTTGHPTHDRSSAFQASSGAPRRNEQAYFIFEAGHRFALAVSDVHEVLDRPEGVELLTWRGETLNIQAVPGLPPAHGGQTLIVVGPQQAWRAWVIERPVAMVQPLAAELVRWPSSGVEYLCTAHPAASIPVLAAH